MFGCGTIWQIHEAHGRPRECLGRGYGRKLASSSMHDRCDRGKGLQGALSNIPQSAGTCEQIRSNAHGMGSRFLQEQ